MPSAFSFRYYMEVIVDRFPTARRMFSNKSLFDVCIECLILSDSALRSKTSTKPYYVEKMRKHKEKKGLFVPTTKWR